MLCNDVIISCIRCARDGDIICFSGAVRFSLLCTTGGNGGSNIFVCNVITWIGTCFHMLDSGYRYVSFMGNTISDH